MLNFHVFIGEGIIIFWTTFGGISIVKVKMEEIMGGIKMYNYGLDHREIAEHCLVLISCPLMCEGRSSLYGR